MLDSFGNTQQELLRLLTQNKAGLTVEELVTALDVTRTAVNQHLRTLERDGYVKRGELQKTRGRPKLTYQLSSKGQNLLPKQYSWFSELLLLAIKEERGSEQLTLYLEKIAKRVAEDIKPRIVDKPCDEQLNELAGVLTELSYQASIEKSDSDRGLPMITATNCVYHDLATKHPEVCTFDLALMSNLLDCNVEHLECMVREGTKCRFRFSQKESVLKKPH